MTSKLFTLSVVGLVALAFLAPDVADAKRRQKKKRHRPSVCEWTTRYMATSCTLERQEDAWVAAAVCLNLSDREERAECRAETRAESREQRALCGEQRAARRALCSAPGFAGRYDPEIDPANFVDVIDNPFAPFRVGSRWTYEKETDEGLEVIEIEVLPDTREILGVTCTTVRDRVTVDGVVVEDTRDWVAQDRDGNVWYFGEISLNYEDGEISDVDGSWEAGVDGAKPGFWVKAAPEVGEFYRQEWLAGEAEDVAEVIDTDADPDGVPFAKGGPILLTRDFTPLEPDAEEFKYYVPGIGLVLETDPEGEERLELISYRP